MHLSTKHPPSMITVALISSYTWRGEIDHNIRNHEKWVLKANQRNAQLVCFPECSLTGYPGDWNYRKVAETIPGLITEAVEKLTRKHNIYVSAGMVELDKKGGKYHIAQVLSGPDGYIGRYRKNNITKGDRKNGISPGQEFPVFLVKGIVFGINICADSGPIRTIKALADQGVHLVHNPHWNGLAQGQNADEWTCGKLEHYPRRAIQARAHVLCNNVGSRDNRGELPSGAMVINPLGQVVARTTQKTRIEKMLLCTIDTDIHRYLSKSALIARHGPKASIGRPLRVRKELFGEAVEK